MTAPPSPLATPVPWNLVSSAYDVDIRPQFERFATDALRLAGVKPGQRVADVATGPGTLQTEMPHLPFGASKMPLTSSDEMRDEMASAGFCDVSVHRIAHAEPPSTVAAMWERMGRSMAPLVLLRRTLGEETWARLGVAVCARLVECFGPEPEPITLTANVGVGTR